MKRVLGWIAYLALAVVIGVAFVGASAAVAVIELAGKLLARND